MGPRHHQLNAHEFEQAPGHGEGQGSLVACHSPGGRKELDMNEQLNNNRLPLKTARLATPPSPILTWQRTSTQGNSNVHIIVLDFVMLVVLVSLFSFLFYYNLFSYSK